jgi:hypothetical protein
MEHILGVVQKKKLQMDLVWGVIVHTSGCISKGESAH